MKNLSHRERIMITALPAGIILLIYFFFFVNPIRAELKALRIQVGAAESRSPTMEAISETLTEQSSLQSEAQTKRAIATERKDRRAALTAFWINPDARARAGEYLGSLLDTHGVVLLEEEVAGTHDRKNYEALLAELPETELWRLRLGGSYSQLQRVLAGLGEGAQLPLLPAAIEMNPMAEGNQSIHIWNLWICR